MARRKYKELGYYAVVTYGPEGTWTSPWYLKKDAKMKHGKNEEVLACHFFDGQLENAELFSRLFDAVYRAKKVREILAKDGHSLTDSVKIVSLFAN